VAVVCWCSARLGGSWAAAISAVVLVAAAPAELQAMLAPTYHVMALLTTALVGALVTLVDAPGGPRRRALAAAVAVFAGANCASDALILVSAVLPLLICAAMMVVSARRLWQPPGPAAILAATGVGALLIAAATVLVRGALNLHAPLFGGPSSPLASPADLGGHLRLVLQGLVHLGHATRIGETAGLTTASGLAGALALAGLCAVAAGGLRAGRAVASRLDASARVGIYWAASTALVLIAFVLSSSTSDVKSTRYLVTLPLGVAASVPLWAGAALRRRIVTALIACPFVLTGAWQLVSSIDARAFELVPYSAGQDRLLADLEVRGLEQGYAPYFDANVLTWKSGGRVAVRPAQNVSHCGRPVCLVPINTISAWYPDPPQVPYFVVMDPLEPDLADTPALGRPTETAQVDRFTVLVFGPPRPAPGE